MTEAESRQAAILRKVRALYAKAASTEHEGEREVFTAKADQLMEAYAIETWQLETGADDEKARLITRVDMDMSWWIQLYQIHEDARWPIWYLFDSCVKHCRCYTEWGAQTYGRENRKITVFGLQADIEYLDLLFTDLFTQIFSRVSPTYDPAKCMGENVMRAKEAGMKYTDIANWLGHPEWVVPNGTGGVKTADNGKMLREYKKYLLTIGKTPRDVVSVHPDSWIIGFVSSFCTKVRQRMRAMAEMRAESRDSSGSMEI